MKKRCKRFFTIAMSCLIVAGMAVTGLVGCKNKSDATVNKQTDKMSVQYVNRYFDDSDLYHDQAYIYMSPLEPTSTDEITLRLKCRYGSCRSAKIWYTEDSVSNCTFQSVNMKFEISDVNGRYEYWIGTLPASSKTRKYHFSLTNDKETVYYNILGLSEEPITFSDADWSIMPDFTTPDWSKGTVWYSAMPDSFYNGNTLNDKTGGNYADAWGNYHTSMSGYFGGDYDGLECKVDYLKELGIDSLFINPIWVTTHQAGYGAFDFMQSDSAFGSEEMLKQLTDVLHQNDMQIMLDAVFEYINVSNILYNSAQNYPYLDGAQSMTDSWYNVVQRHENGEAVYSAWGSPCINFSSEIVRDYFYRNNDSVMQYYLREVGIDGWRMDVGNNLSGSDKNNFGTSTQILKDMRQYIKKANEDALFLSEHANGDQFDYILDSKWNYSFGYAIRDWAAGLSNPSVLMNTIENGVLGLPRSVANASYNFLTTHDLPRLIDIAEYEGGDKTSIFNAANLLMFTFVGSPCVYYGEEVGLMGLNVIEKEQASSFWNSMEWDESEFNYEIYDMTKALAKLRKEYPSLYTDGAYLNVYSKTDATNPSGIISFARFAEEGAAITAVNPTNSIVKNFELNVGKIDNIRDGDTLTDYLTGRKYTVKEGKVTIDVYPGGSVLVTGEASENVVGNMLKTSVGTAEYTATLTGNNELSVDGKGMVSSVSDNFGFIYNRAFGNAEVSVRLSGGDYALMIRDGLAVDDSFFGVKIAGNKVRAFASTKKGGNVSYFTTKEFSEGSLLTVVRDDDNKFYYTVDGKQYEITTVDADYYVYSGIGITGKATIKEFSSVLTAQQRSTDFSMGIGSFTYADGEYVLNEGLTLQGSGDRSVLYAPICMSDFTVKTLLKSTFEKGYAGIAIGNSDDYIFAGRYGGEIILAHVTDGDIAVYASIVDIECDIVLQLEKVANKYTAIVIDGAGEQTVIGKNILANYSELSAMLIASDCNATFGYLSFGDDMDGRKGFAAYKKEGSIDFGFTTSTSGYSYSIVGGSWNYVIGGIEQTDINAQNAHYAFSANTLTNFRASFALRVDFKDENSYVQAMWAKSSIGSGQGYAFRLKPDGTAMLINSREDVLDEYKIKDFTSGKEYDFTLSVSGNNAFVYFGTDEKLILSTNLAGGSGYFSWTGNCTKFAILSYGVFSADSNYKVLTGEVNVFENSYVKGGLDIEISGGGGNYGYMTMTDTAVSDFAMSFNLQLMRTSLISRGRFRFYIGTKSGYNSLNSGLVVQLDDRGRINIYEDGKQTVANCQIEGIDTESCYLVIVYRLGKLTLYKADYNETLIYTKDKIQEIYYYQDSFCRSGAMSFYTHNATVKLANIRAIALDEKDEYLTSELFTYYFIDSPPAPEPEIVSAPATVGYENDFSDRMTLGDFTRYSGAVEIKDGMLVVDGLNGENWDAGTGLAYGTFENFELTVRVKIQNLYGWGAIEFNKSSPSVNHQQSSLTLMLTAGGGSLYLGNDITQPNSSVGVVYDDKGFMTVTLRVENGVITFDLGAESISFAISELASNNNLTSGFISFNAGCNRVYFDDLKIMLL